MIIGRLGLTTEKLPRKISELAALICVKRAGSRRPILDSRFRLNGSDPLHAVAFKDFSTRRTQPRTVLLQALLNGHIVTQLFSAKA
jgi:hypothetical protein